VYAAAGHPPLLRWRDDELEQIESNGLLFGVKPEFADCPVSTMQIVPGDRLLLYTDGVSEPENADGDSFGDKRLEQVVRNSRTHSASELSDRLLAELRMWQSGSSPQQDDITLIVIDAV
jgi:sigma-B regulation protein RsbU (phosphoserine phosphatase)